MIDVTPSGLLKELDAAETYFRSALEGVVERRRRLTGPYFMAGNYLGTPNDWKVDPENHAYEMARLMVPRLGGGNPTIELDTNRPDPEARVVRALEFAQNRWTVDSMYVITRQQLAIDYLLQYGVSTVTLAPRPGLTMKSGDPVLWPACRRTSFKNFRWDPIAPSFYDARWTATRIVRDKEDVLREAHEHPDRGWNIPAIEGLPANTGTETLGRDDKIQVDRREIVYWEIRVPEYQLEAFPDGSPGAPLPEDGFNGTKFTLGVGQNVGSTEVISDFLRVPQPFYGPRWGSNQLFGYMPVPDVSVPLASLVAVESQVRELNSLVRAQSRSDRRYKRLVLVDSRHPQLQQILKSGEHDFVIPVPGLRDGEVVPIEIAGSTDQMLRGIQLAMDRLHRMSGRGSAQRGFASGEATATENSIAQEASEISVQWEIERFRIAEEMLHRTVLWYLYHTDEVVIPLGAEASQFFGTQNPIYVGGFEGDRASTRLDFDSLNVRIRAVPEGIARQQRMELLGMATQVAPLMPQTPWVRWQEWATAIGQVNRYEEFHSLFDWDLLTMMQLLPPAEDPAGAEPRMGRDTPAGATRFQAIPGAAGTVPRAMGGPRQGSGGDGQRGFRAPATNGAAPKPGGMAKKAPGRPSRGR